MKRVLVIVLAVAVAVGLAAVSFAEDKIEVKEKTVVNEGKEVTKIEAKDTETGAKVKVKERTMAPGTMTKEEAKAPGVKIEKKQYETADAVAGKTKVKIKHGAIKKLSVEYDYYQEGTEYIIEYNIKDKADPDLVSELNLTPEQAATITPGYHKIVSTSPFTVSDVQGDFRSVIIKDIQQAALAKKKK